MAGNTEWETSADSIRERHCVTCDHTGYSHFYDRLGNLAECHVSACKCLLFSDPTGLSPTEIDTMMSQCWDEDADAIIHNIAALIAGLQVPISLGMGRDGVLGTAAEPWHELFNVVGGGWCTTEEIESRLRERLTPR